MIYFTFLWLIAISGRYFHDFFGYCRASGVSFLSARKRVLWKICPELPEVIKDIKKTSSLIDVDIRNISLRSGLQGSSKYWQYSFVLNIQNICSYIWLAMICPILLIFLVCKGIKILEISVLWFGLQIFKIFVCRYSKY